MVRVVKIIGIDPSYTATGIAGAKGATTIKWLLEGRERLVEAYDYMWITALTADLVVIEGYSHGSGYNSHKMGELGGAIRVAMMQRGTPFLDVQPTTLKKYATGKGNASKPDMVAAARDLLGYEGKRHDEADAMWLRQIGGKLHGQPWAVDVPDVNMSALEVFTEVAA